MNNTPRNHLKREARVARWNNATQVGKAFRPQPIIGKAARYKWLHAVGNPDGDISATVRLVAAFLSLNGNPDGSRISPGVRRVAGECNLSPRVVSESLDTLVRRGFLRREWKVGNAAGSGFRYVLTIPDVLTERAHLNGQGVDAACTPNEVCTEGAHGVHSGADRCALSRTEVCTERAPTILKTSTNTSAHTPAPVGQKARGRALPDENPQVQVNREHPAAMAAAAATKPSEEIPK